jgi:hypothetical protein
MESHVLEQEATRIRTARHPVQTVATVIGAAFLLVGILGFVPGVTSDYDQLGFAGHHSGAMLLGLFSVSVLHNLVHLAFGVAGVLLGRMRTPRASWAYLVYGGAIYLLLCVYGLIIGFDSSANFVPVNTADNWLHLGLAVVMLGAGLGLGRSLFAGSTDGRR